MSNSSTLHAYVREVKNHSQSKEVTAASNAELSRDYAVSRVEFEALRIQLAAELTPTLGSARAEIEAERQALQGRDLRLREKLINLNLRLVIKIANEYPLAKSHLTDLISEGNIGLMKGIDRYDPAHGVPLANYCADWIRAYIIRYIVNTARLVKLGTTETQRRLFFNLNKMRARLEAQGIAPTDESLAQSLSTVKLKILPAEVAEMSVRLSAPEASLQLKKEFPGSDSEAGAGGPCISDLRDDKELPDAALEAAQDQAFRVEFFQRFRNTLPVKLTRFSKRNLFLEILDRRLLAEEEETFEEIGGADLTKQRVQQVSAELEMHLREFVLDELGGPI